MGLKKILRNEVKESKKREKEKRKKYERSLLRTDEEWEVVERYLRDRILQEIEESDGDFWIEIDLCSLNFPKDKNGEDIYFNDKKDEENRLRVNHKDVERFCKKYHLKLRYLGIKNFCKEEYVMYKKFIYNIPGIISYCIKVKPWKML